MEKQRGRDWETVRVFLQEPMCVFFCKNLGLALQAWRRDHAQAPRTACPWGRWTTACARSWSHHLPGCPPPRMPWRNSWICTSARTPPAWPQRPQCCCASPAASPRAGPRTHRPLTRWRRRLKFNKLRSSESTYKKPNPTSWVLVPHTKKKTKNRDSWQRRCAGMGSIVVVDHELPHPPHAQA